MKEFKKELSKANELRTLGKNREALKIYEKAYREHPEEFSHNQKNDYAWAIYKTRIAFFKSEDELFENAEFITGLVCQRDFNRYTSCVFTSTVFKVLYHFKEQKDFASMITWLEMLDVDLLDQKPYRKNGRINKSHKELYYDWASRAYLQNMDYEKCIEVSRTALDSLERFFDEDDTWFKFRIAKSLIELGHLTDGLAYYEEVIKVKHDWYMYRDIAEVYFRLGKPWIALDYLCPAVLSEVPLKTKMNVYYLCFKVLESSNRPMALKHAELYYLIRRENSYSIPYEIEKLGLDESQLDKNELESEIRRLWIQYKFKDQKPQQGTVTKFFEDKNYGFIDDEIFFHKSEFDGETVFIGQMVTFYTEESFDKAKNRKSTKAVNVTVEVDND